MFIHNQGNVDKLICNSNKISKKKKKQQYTKMTIIQKYRKKMANGNVLFNDLLLVL